MRKNRRIAALLTAGLLALTPCVSAGMMYASAENCTITVDNSVEGYEYTAYKIFKGDKSGEDPNFVLSNLDWADGFKGAEFLTALKGDSVLGTTFASANNPEAVATALDTIKTDNNKLAQFAKLAFANKGTTTSVASAYDATKGYSIPATEAGYYLVEETTVPSGAVTSRYMLKVAGPTDVSPKRELPTLTKVITGDTARDNGKANGVSIGDKVPYELSTKVPDMTGYTKYFFVINDDLEDGLTFNNDVAITIGGTPTTDFTVQTDSADTNGHSFQIVFNDFYNKNKGNAGKDIVITYSATLNEKADRTKTGNLNTANLVYSNNPNITPTGDPDNPDEPNPPTPDNPDTPEDESKPGDPTGQTPDQQTKTYTANIKLTKTDGTNALAGAKFQISGDSVKAVLIDGTAYVADEAGTYRKLKDGTFTTDTTKASDLYDGNTLYKKVENIDKTTTYTNICKEVYVKADGTLDLGGLGSGTYTITELEAPKGYNKLDPASFTITIGNANATFNTPAWTAETDLEDTEVTMDQDTATASLTVVNKEGSTLPSTGGVGTKLFYLFGGMLAVGSGVVLVTKKRMSYEK